VETKAPMPTETPRTDAAWKEVARHAAYPGDAEPLHEVCGDLERELAEAKEALGQFQRALSVADAERETLSAIVPKWLETERRKIDQVACEIDEAMRSKIKSSDTREVLQSWWKRLDAISLALLRTTDGGKEKP
jgi:hypothetical protein